MVSNELLPCPFCGGDAKIYRHYGGFSIGCANAQHDSHCPMLPRLCAFNDEAEAVAAWNTRHERTCRNVCDWRDDGGVLHSDARLFKCSECGFKADDFYGDDEQSFPRYCPNCGAKVVCDE